MTVAVVAVAGGMLYQARPSDSFPSSAFVRSPTATASTAFLGHGGSHDARRESGGTWSSRLSMAGNNKVSGSFFNSVPDDADEAPKSDAAAPPADGGLGDDPFGQSLHDLLQDRTSEPRGSTPSTVGGVPLARTNPTTPAAAAPVPFVSIGTPDGTPVNDPTNPKMDDQGFVLYTDESTGEQSRVLEGLVTYPCNFKIKIVGANEGTFVPEMVAVVAESCEVDVNNIDWSERRKGKWTSITVNAPVKSADMLYVLYENIDRDPRVKFKF